MRGEKIIKDAVGYSASNYLANVLDFISGVIIRRLLGPATMGIFVELLLLFDYGKNHDLGVLNALDREVPILNGKKAYAEVKKISHIGFTSCIATSVLLGIILVLYSLFMQAKLDSRLIGGIRIVAILNIIQAFVSFYIVITRTHQRFDILSRYIFFTSIVNLILTATLLFKFKFPGLLAALALVGMFRFFYLFLESAYRFKLIVPFPFSEVKKLIKIGFPLLLSGFIFMTLRSIDRFMIIAFLDRINLGYYSIATMMHGYIFQLPNLIYAVFFPHFYEAYGRTGSIEKIKEYFVFPTLSFVCLFPFLIGTAILTLPLVLNYMLPKYISGLWPAVILMLGTFFISLAYMPGYVLTVLNKQHYIVGVGFCVVILSLLLNYILLKFFHLGLVGVAVATATSYFIYSFLINFIALKNYRLNVKDYLKFFTVVYGSFVWFVAALFLIYLVFGTSVGGLKRDILRLSIEIPLFLVACLPLVFYLNKKTTIFNTCFSMAVKKLNSF